MITATPTFSMYRNGDFVQYVNNVLQLVTPQHAANLRFEDQRNVLSRTMDKLNEAFTPALGSELTPEIAALDDRRDDLFSGLRITLNTWAKYHYEPVKKQAAKKFARIITNYGWRIHKLRYQQQTATISAIVNDFESVENQPDLRLLGLEEWTAELKATNISFNENYLARTEELSELELGVVAELREQATTQYRALRDIFNARAAVALADGTPEAPIFEAIGKDIDALTEQYNQAVKRFRNNEDEDLPPDDPQPIP